MENTALVTSQVIHQMIKEGEGANIHKRAMELLEKPLIEMTLINCRGNQTEAANILGINRGTLRKKMRQYGFMK